MSPSVDEQYEEALRLYRAGEVDDAVPRLRALAEIGYVSAYFRLAHYEFYYREQENAKPWIGKLETAAAAGDPDACLYCFHAYRGGWALGEFARDEAKGSDYLRRAAELGNEAAQWLLADEHRSGANGQVKDEGLYVFWVEKAIAGGDVNAIYSHAEWLADRDRPVPASLMADLAKVAEDYRKAARLLERLRQRSGSAS